MELPSRVGEVWSGVCESAHDFGFRSHAGQAFHRFAVLSGDGILHGFPTSRLPICCLPFQPAHHFEKR